MKHQQCKYPRVNETHPGMACLSEGIQLFHKPGAADTLFSLPIGIKLAVENPSIN